ncbi:amino acid kinase [Methylococcus sp. EFPC2]|uniref:amino acid kinase family protein n=1 Tax=Methylococcus sp. EFPC2 TaxID=2812648 RepID=UPI001967DA31|nr:amino acid kinase [Methylococcus sp. EFPC2]QSA96740.1 amino acid kinase [Methylococcus sp. EFPC2]
MWVLKLGGSLADGDALPHWLDALAGCPVVVVPGGGPFADAVRTAQARWHFDEQTAHEMAILGMQQYGRMLLGLNAGLRAARSPCELAGRLPAVWLPEPETLSAARVPASWDITSDSLAAWLAVATGASHLLLVKSVSSQGGARAVECDDLIAQGVVDPAFREYGRDASLQSWWCGPGDYVHLPDAWHRPADSFVRIRFDRT